MRQAPDPMPGILARLEDPWGIGWRVVNLLRRASARRTGRFAWGYVRGVRYERPVFVIGAPRSGTTMLFRLLRESEELRGLPGEAHDIWRAFHHPRWGGWRSDAVGAGQVRRGERRFVSAAFYARFGAGRFVEKTPENCLRVAYLLELFPDASFVAVRRNPCDVVSSLVSGWRDPAGRYRSYFVPKDLDIPGYPHRRRWCFALIDGWRDYVSAPVPEIAFAQWDACTSALEAARPLVEPDRWIDVYFEDLLERADETLSLVCAAVGITRTPALERKLHELLANPANALSAPGDGKWKRDNPREIAELLPRIAARARDRGYLVDPDTGEVALVRDVARRAPVA